MITSKSTQRRPSNRSGFSLLELLATLSLMGILATSVAMSLRTSRVVWEGYNSEAGGQQTSHAIVRQIVRRVRQATEVGSISSPSSSNGLLSITDHSGTVETWTLVGNEVRYGSPLATDLLGDGISELHFTGYEDDARTQTIVVADIRMIEIEVVTMLPRRNPPKQTLRCRAWLRAN